MAESLEAKMTIDTDSERLIPSYRGSARFAVFVLVVFRCPSCGEAGPAGSWCEGHSAPMETGGRLRVKREPVLVPQADPERTTTEIYDRREDDDD